jgi:hypothetical protein
VTGGERICLKFFVLLFFASFFVFRKFVGAGAVVVGRGKAWAALLVAWKSATGDYWQFTGPSLAL